MILDGHALARLRAPVLAARAEAVTRRRGHPPTLLLIAFGEAGRAPHVDRKVVACSAVGVRAIPLVLEPDVSTAQARAAMSSVIDEQSPDAAFLQFPFPPGIDEDEFARALPEALDVDIMSPARVRFFAAHADALPPVTVTAGLLLLDDYGIDPAGLSGLVIADPSPFAAMFRLAFVRRGTEMHPLLAPHTPDLLARVSAAQLVIVAAGQPGLLHTRDLADGTVAIDVGYFNPGGRGDIDTSTGTDHLAAIAPVPGGIGPMTISALIERVIAFSESR